MSNDTKSKLKIEIPAAQKQQLYQAIVTLFTVVLGIVLTLSAQVVSDGFDLQQPEVTDPLLGLGTTHFADIAADSFTGDLTGNVTASLNTENFALPSVLATTVTYTPTSGTIATIPADEVWIIHNVFVRTATSFACTGDNCTLTVGDGNDADGFITAADANLQSTFTEATGYPAGWFGLENGSNGAYTVDEGLFVYAPAAAETIDYAVGGTSPAAGAATVYVVYTRIQ